MSATVAAGVDVQAHGVHMKAYCGDDYPREGCTLTIDVHAQYGYGLTVHAPNGALMEKYMFVKTPRAIGRMVEEWCAGHVPKLHHRLDQPKSEST